MKAKGCFGRTVLRGSILIILATVVAGQAATSSQVPKASTRATATSLDAATLRPIWIFGDKAATETTRVASTQPSVITVKPVIVSSSAVATESTLVRVRVHVQDVQVPARPLPRDPFSPPR